MDNLLLSKDTSIVSIVTMIMPRTIVTNVRFFDSTLNEHKIKKV